MPSLLLPETTLCPPENFDEMHIKTPTYICKDMMFLDLWKLEKCCTIRSMTMMSMEAGYAAIN